MASDTSFRLPAYDNPNSSFNLQSDLDVSASEVEDKQPANLDSVSKEQLHQAYRKSLDRYQKYRLRYTELARRYRDLEKDNSKARSVLLETQDKALRRINELREQCNLEQQAKTHMESVLRLEMDEMQCVIKTLKTKLEVTLTEDKLSEENLISLANAGAEENSEEGLEILKNNITRMEETINEYQRENKTLVEQKTEESKNYQKQINDLNNKIKQLQLREEDNAILLAENKMIVHSELENKDGEVKGLRDKLSSFENDVKRAITEKKVLEQQVSDLKKIVNELNQSSVIKLSETESLVKTLSDDKHKLEVSIKDMEKNILNLGNEKKELDNLVRSFEIEVSDLKQKEQELGNSEGKRIELEKELENLKNLQNDKNLEDQIEQLKSEIETMKNEKLKIENQLKEVFEEKKQVNFELKQIKDKMEKVNNKFKKLSDEKNTLQQQNENLNRENQVCKEEIISLEQQKSSLNEEVKSIKIINENTESDAIRSLQDSMKVTITSLEEKLLLAGREVNAKSDQLNSLTRKNSELIDSLDKEKDDSIHEVSNLKSKIESLKNEKKDLEKTLEKEIREKSELKTQVTNILQEIGRLEEQLKDVKNSYSEISKEKRSLEEKVEKSQKQISDSKNKDKEKIKELEIRFKKYQSESTEKNSILEENNSHLQNSVKESEISLQKLEEKLNLLENVRIDHETAKEAILKLEEKLLQCLDENSRLFNAKELMEHEYRSLQDQLETKDKEKLCLLDNNKCLEEKQIELSTTLKQKIDELNQIMIVENSVSNLETEKNNLTEKCDQLIKDIELERQEKNDKQNELNLLGDMLKIFETEVKVLKDEKKIAVKEVELLKAENENNSDNNQILINQSQNKLLELETLLKQIMDENQFLKDSNSELEKSLSNFDEKKIENEYLNTLVKQLECDLLAGGDEKKIMETETSELRDKLKAQQCEIYVFETKQKEIEDENNLTKLELKSNQAMITDLNRDFENIKTEKIKLELFEEENKVIKLELESYRIEISKLNKDINDFNEIRVQNLELLEKIKDLESKTIVESAEQCLELQQKLKDLEQTTNGKISNLNQEIDELLDNAKFTKDKLTEFDMLRQENSDLKERIGNSVNPNISNDFNELLKEKNDLDEKLKKILYEVQDVSNRNLFLEQKCENYLIIEQSNERLKNSNDKLTRQLDETLVSF